MHKSLTKFHLPLLALLLLMSVGLISKLPPWRIDLTQDKLYTLSSGTLNLLNKLQGEPIHLTFYYSNKETVNLPTIRAYSRRVRETLREYALRSHGKIILDIVDPEPFSEQEDRAVSAGLQAVPVGNNDTIYFGLVGEKSKPGRHQDTGKEVGKDEDASAKQETIAFFNAEKENSLEYDISQLIYRLNQPKPLVVGIISDLPIFQHRNMSSPQTIKPKIILEQLRQMFDIKRVYDTNIDKIDDEVDLLMVVQPHLWPEQTLYAIDQFVLRGGRLVVFMDPYAEMDESEKGLFSGAAFTDKSSSLEQLLPAWGVRYDPKKIVLDYHFAQSIPVTRYGQALPHVGVLGIREEGFNRAEAMTSSVDQVNIASAGALSPLPGATTHFSMLMQSSANSELMDSEEYRKFSNHELLLQKFKADGKGPYTLAAYITGSAKTAFPQGKPVIKQDSENDPPKDQVPAPGAVPVVAHSSPTYTKDPSQFFQSTKDIAVVLFADTDILDDRMWVQVQDFYGQPEATPWASNSDLIVNVMEKLSGSTDLINVRSRGSYNRPFERVDALEKIASEQLRTEEENLQNKLNETEVKLQQLTHPATGAAEDVSTEQELTPEQKQEVEKFQQERLQIRKNLRQVRHGLNQDIERLGSQLKMINLLAIPVLLTLLVLAISLRRRYFPASAKSRAH